MNQPAMNDTIDNVFDSATDLPGLYKLLDGVKMKNGWAKPTPSIYPQPKQAFVPAHWHYSDARAALHAAGRLVGTEWAERRNLIMANPIPGNDYPTVSTLVGAYQMVKGGETARSHRHTPNAMRVVIEAAENTFTVVDGIKIPMLPGDVLLTPNWCYHGHSNDSQQDAYWIDFLDAPLVQFLGPMFYNEHPDGLEKVTGVDANSPMRFAFHDYHPKLLAAPEVATGVRLLELGPPTLVTFDRTVVSVKAGAKWINERSTANCIYTVIAGSGRSRAGALDFTWSKGDMFAVPSWNPHTHEATEDAVLLQVSDEPLMRMLNWNRTGPA
jgi:gentisate 1,2-dioxygenase